MLKLEVKTCMPLLASWMYASSPSAWPLLSCSRLIWITLLLYKLGSNHPLLWLLCKLDSSYPLLWLLYKLGSSHPLWLLYKLESSHPVLWLSLWMHVTSVRNVIICCEQILFWQISDMKNENKLDVNALKISHLEEIQELRNKHDSQMEGKCSSS